MKKYPADIMAVDIGNTSVKTYLADPFDKCATLECMRTSSVAEAAERARLLGIEKVAYLTTRKLTKDERNIVRDNGWWEFTSRSKVPMEVCYDLSTLGPDRLALAVACSSEFNEEGCLIVDAGTALTIDLISCSGEYLGGTISPGMRMRFKALNKFTSRLPYVEGGVLERRFGQNTQDAIMGGVIMGIVGEIVLAYKDAVKMLGIESMVITGGDSEFLAETVARYILDDCENIKRILMEEGIVGMGLIEAYMYNHD